MGFSIRLRQLCVGHLSDLSELLHSTLLSNIENWPTLAKNLNNSANRAAAIGILEQSFSESSLINPEGAAEISRSLRAGKSASELFSRYRIHFGRLESVLRLQNNLENLPDQLRSACTWLTQYAELHSADEGVAAFEASALRRHLNSVLQQNPQLAHIDTTRIDTAFDELNDRLLEKQRLTRSLICSYWAERQRSRLLVESGNRLNSLGASMRQRLLVRGKRALKLRQMVKAGAETEGGDSLFDLCPVWMASADTVAQIFPREPLFDVVIFDEASQCRLEEALPVLLRGNRVVIVGDPRQLPPSLDFLNLLWFRAIKPMLNLPRNCMNNK